MLKYPFWQMTAKNPKAIYACVNFGKAVCPEDIMEQAICIDGDIGAVIDEKVGWLTKRFSEPLKNSVFWQVLYSNLSVLWS